MHTNMHTNMHMNTCLIMDPSGELQGLACESLGRLGLRCEVTRHPESFVGRKRYDVVLMDMRPYLDFNDAFQRVLRGVGQACVIGFLSPRDAVDRVLALEMGADAIIVPPFGAEEIGARVRAMLRRRALSRLAEAHVAHARLEVATRTLHVADAGMLSLSANETALLQQLALRPGEVMSRGELLSRSGMGREGATVQTVELVVSRLRHKLRRTCQPALPVDPIRTVRGQGYAWCAAVLQLAVEARATTTSADADAVATG